MEGLALLKAIAAKLRTMQFNENEHAADSKYVAGHNDAMRAAVREVESHIGVAFACVKGCGWSTSGKGTGRELTDAMRRYGRCPGKDGKSCGAPVEMAEVVL